MTSHQRSGFDPPNVPNPAAEAKPRRGHTQPIEDTPPMIDAPTLPRRA